jgi:hypothetical protein
MLYFLGETIEARFYRDQLDRRQSRHHTRDPGMENTRDHDGITALAMALKQHPCHTMFAKAV